MKKILLFTTLCVLFISTKAQVYTGDLYFFNQTEVDQFVLENPNIAAIEGNVELGELSDLSGLSQLQPISGTLTINSFDLSYLQDLQSLNSVYQLQIFNRWGNRIFISSETTPYWKPDELSEGTYYFILEYLTYCGEGASTATDGSITILR